MIQITYKYNDLEEAKSLTPVVEQKFTSLEKFVADGVPATLEIEFIKVGEQQHGKVFQIDANVTIDGKMYRATATEESFEMALDSVRQELDKEIRRAKDKDVSLLKRAGRQIKESLMGS